MRPEEPEFSARCAARVLRVKPHTVLRWIANGRIPAEAVRIHYGVQRRIYLQRRYVLELREELRAEQEQRFNLT